MLLVYTIIAALAKLTSPEKYQKFSRAEVLMLNRACISKKLGC